MIKEPNILPSYFVMPLLRRNVIPLPDAEREIIHMICEHYGLTEEELRSPTRKRETVFPRHLSMYLIHRKTKLSLLKIAHIFGRNDHSTTVNAIQSIQNFIDTNSLNKRQEILYFLSTIHVNNPQQRA